MNLVTALLLIGLLLTALVFGRKRNDTSRTAGPVKRPTRRSPGAVSTEYHAVSIKTLPSACEAAKSLEGRRFLSGEAPRLPLADCDAADCHCRFIHFKDRRSGDDRRSPFARGFGGGGDTATVEKERRRLERRDDSPEDFF